MLKHHKDEVLTFSLSSRQLQQFQKWKSSLPELDHTIPINSAYVFKFIPMGTGTKISVERIDGYSIKLDDYLNYF